MVPQLETPLALNGLSIPNRLYRAPLLECAGNHEDTVEILISELEPAAEAGVGLIFQGAAIVRPESGCAAPNMTRVHDPAFVRSCAPLPERIESHGSRIFIQLEHGGLRSLETWHAGYREDHPEVEQLAVSEPPPSLRLMDRLGLLALQPHILSTDEVYELAADFGSAAAAAVDAGYHGIHIAGANMGIVEQFCSPFFNRRTDEFGGDLTGRTRFLEEVLSEIRRQAGDSFPVVTKVPAESVGPHLTRRRLSIADGVAIAERVAAMGYDGIVPVTGSGFWDSSIVRGAFPDRAWHNESFREGYNDAFGGPLRRRLVEFGNRIQSMFLPATPAWNEAFCRRVKQVVDVPVFAEGGIRNRHTIDRLLRTGACDMIGMGRPFYAEPRLPARLLRAEPHVRTICESCNNCTVPQVTGAPGVCRTPSVLAKHGTLVTEGAYETEPAER